MGNISLNGGVQATQLSNKLLKTNHKLSKTDAVIFAFMVSLTLIALNAVLWMVLVGMLFHYGILHATLSYPQALLTLLLINVVFRSTSKAK